MSESAYIFDVNQQTFQQYVLENSHKVPVLVDFWADWCQPCKMLMPVMEKLIDELNGQCLLAKVNSDQEQELSRQYGVRGIPNVKVFRYGELVDEFTGVQTEEFIRELVNKYAPSEVDDLRSQAMQHIRNLDFDQGREILLKAEAIDPAHASIQVDLAYLDAEQRNYVAARERLMKLPPDQREKPEVSGLLAKMAFASAAEQAGDRTSLEARIQTDPKDLEARYLLANIDVNDGQYEAALEQFLQVLMRNVDYEGGAAKQGMLSLFKLLGDEHPLTIRYRRKMFTALH